MFDQTTTIQNSKQGAALSVAAAHRLKAAPLRPRAHAQRARAGEGERDNGARDGGDGRDEGRAWLE